MCDFCVGNRRIHVVDRRGWAATLWAGFWIGSAPNPPVIFEPFER